MEKQNQLALVPLKSLDSLEVSSTQFDGDEVLVEDWVSDNYSEAAELPNEGVVTSSSGTTGLFSTLGHGRTGSCGCGESSEERILL